MCLFAVPSSIPDSAGLRWYLVQCKPREDDRALEHLERQGFECYRPLRRTARRYPSGRKYVASAALFPGYVFVRLNRVHDDWHSVHSTRGVSRIVRFRDYLPVLEDDLVARIRRRLAVRDGIEPYLQPGDRVRILEGAFSELEAIFVSENGDDRVLLLLNILQQEQRLSFPVASVRKAQ